MINEVGQLIYREILLELRQKSAINGILLYVISTIFICYLSFITIPEVSSWNALFWIIMLFAATNAVAKSFLQESKGVHLYLYTLASPQSIITAKILYNCLLMIILSFLCYIAYNLFIPLENEIDQGQFVVALLLGSTGFSALMTMMSAIASRANNNITLMAVLSFPLLLPLLITLIKLSGNAIQALDWSFSYKYIIVLLGLNIITIVLGVLLFPYLWKE